MIEYTETMKTWKLWDPEAKRMIRSADVIFIEENAIGQKSSEPDMIDVEDSQGSQVSQVIEEDPQGSQVIEEDSRTKHFGIPLKHSRDLQQKGNCTIHLHTIGRKHGRRFRERAT